VIARALRRLLAALFGSATSDPEESVTPTNYATGRRNLPHLPLFTVDVREVPDVRSPEPARPIVAMPPSAFTVEVMRESYYKHIIAGLIGDEAPADGIVKPALCVPESDGSVRVEIDGAMVGYLDSKYWWHYRMTMNGAAADCRALIKGRLTPGHDDPDRFDVTLDLVLPPLHPDIAVHSGVAYECEVVGDSKFQPALRGIFRTRAARDPAAWAPLVTAQLVREDTEAPSIRVEIGGQTVGHLGKVNARKYRERADGPKTVPAFIAEVEGSDGRKRYSVSLSLALP
jgi:hypothetical protein